MSNGLPFEYAQRAHDLQFAKSPEHRTALEEQRDTALEDYLATIAATITPTDWVDLTYSNGWTNTASNQVGQYRKIGDIVYLRGYLTPGTWGVTAFTLPVGFRPPANLDIPVASWTGAAPSAAHMYVQTTGNVLFQRTTGNFASFSVQFSVTA